MKNKTKKIILVSSALLSVTATIVALNRISSSNQNIQYLLTPSRAPEDYPHYARDTMYRFEHPFLGEDEMPIVGLLPIPGYDTEGGGSPSFINRGNFEIYKNAGFNIYCPAYERIDFKESQCREAVDLCDEFELVYFTNMAAYRAAGSNGYNGSVEHYEDLLDSAKWVTSRPCFGGFQIKDEPNYDDFEEFRKAQTAFRNKFPDQSKCMLHTTLFPMGANDEQLHLTDKLPGASHEDRYWFYIDCFLDTVEPNILAYDSYLWHVRGSELNTTTYEVYYFFNSLSYYAYQAKTRNIPLWPTVTTYRHSADEPYTDEMTTWTVNAYLAYGAKGMQYYLCWPYINNYTSGDYLNNPSDHGLVSSSGAEIDEYYRIQKINNQIKVVQDVLMNSTNMGILQFGDIRSQIPERDQLTKYGFLRNITGGNAFVGCFDHNGKDVYYIMNNAIDSDHEASELKGKKIFKVDFDKKVNVRYKNVDYGTVEKNGVYSIAFTLEAGEAMLVEVL